MCRFDFSEWTQYSIFYYNQLNLFILLNDFNYPCLAIERIESGCSNSNHLHHFGNRFIFNNPGVPKFLKLSGEYSIFTLNQHSRRLIRLKNGSCLNIIISSFHEVKSSVSTFI